ncbi:hypothetical protein [[Kitasatospora] papulosa]
MLRPFVRLMQHAADHLDVVATSLAVAVLLTYLAILPILLR